VPAGLDEHCELDGLLRVPREHLHRRARSALQPVPNRGRLAAGQHGLHLRRELRLERPGRRAAEVHVPLFVGLCGRWRLGDLHGAGVGGGGFASFSSSAAPRPVTTSMHLTTAVSSLRYSPDGALLLMGSHSLKDQLRLLHTASGTVAPNWPTQRTPLHFVTAAAFSPGGAFLSIGNDRGRALLYRLHHYQRV